MIIIKKVIRITLLIIAISTMFMGCTDTNVSQPQNEENEFEELVVSDIKYDKSTKVISYNVENKSDETLYTGVGYFIEKYDDKNNWTKTNLTDNLAFIEIAIAIEPNKLLKDTIDLSQIKTLEDGYYRIVKNYNNEKNNITQYIQFEVSDDNLTNFQSYNKLNK